jgi:hypothetical protein
VEVPYGIYRSISFGCTRSTRPNLPAQSSTHTATRQPVLPNPARTMPRNQPRALVTVRAMQVFFDGFFNADPHPGNILVTFDRETNKVQRVASSLVVAEGHYDWGIPLLAAGGKPSTEAHQAACFRSTPIDFVVHERRSARADEMQRFFWWQQVRPVLLDFGWTITLTNVRTHAALCAACLRAHPLACVLSAVRRCKQSLRSLPKRRTAASCSPQARWISLLLRRSAALLWFPL